LALRTIGFRQACAIKSAAMKFWLWFFQSQTAHDVASSLSFVIPPLQIRDAHGIDSLLTTGVFCRGELSAPAERTEQSLGIGSSLANDLFTLYPIVYNNLATANGTIAYEDSGSDDALQSLIFGEVDFAVTVGELTRSDWLYEAMDDGSVFQLPMFISRFTMVYNLPTLTGSNNALVMDYGLLQAIWSGDVRSWDDPQIAALNPDLAAAGQLPSLNITRIVSTSGEREADRTFFQSLAYWTQNDADPFNLTYDSTGVPEAYWSLPWLNAKDSLITQVSSDDKVQAAVTNQIGAIGITVVDSGLEVTTQRMRLKKPTGDIITEAALSAYRCTLDTFNVTDLTFGLYSKHSLDYSCIPSSCR
jgi:ABC-type phosphate transport system substrate-binding protein